MPVSHRSIRSQKAKENRKRAKLEERERLEQYGSKELRATYLNMSLGRLVLDGPLQEIANNIGKHVTLKALQPLALVLIPGHKFAEKAQFGLLDKDKPRLTPSELTALIAERMLDPRTSPEMRLAESSTQPLTVYLESLLPKKRGQTFRAASRIIDAPTDSYQATGQLLGEKAAVMKRFGYEVAGLTRPLLAIDHYIHFAEGNIENLDSYMKALIDEDLPQGTEITLGPVSPVPIPR